VNNDVVSQNSGSEPASLSPSPRRRRRWLRRFGATVLVMGVIAGACVVDAESMAGDDPFEVKLGIWGREHGLGFAITWLEEVQYALNPPATGGTTSVATVLHATGYKARARVTSTYQPLTPIDKSSSLPNEGRWNTLIASSGEPVISMSLMRPDSTHTSYLAAVVRINGKRATLNLHPGSEDPGNASRFQSDDVITKSDWKALIGAFNGGFKIKDAQGGFYLNGATAGTLAHGAASLVTYKDGHSDIGAWGSDVSMSANVASVRQNLHLVVDNGRVTPSADAAVKSSWGATVGGAYYVWRTGIGIRADGDLVFVLGDALSAQSLAQLLQSAGAVRAMQLDINQDWAAFYYFTRPSGHSGVKPTAHKVIPFRKPLSRYFTTVTRDFYTISLNK
jgi:hypothetical protein